MTALKVLPRFRHGRTLYAARENGRRRALRPRKPDPAKPIGAALACACTDNGLRIDGGNGYATEYQSAAEIQAQMIGGC